MKKLRLFYLIISFFLLVGCSNQKYQESYSSLSDSSSVESHQPIIEEFGSFINEWEYLTNQFKAIDTQILPDIIYAILSVSVEDNQIDVKVEILEDKKNGKQYHVCNEFIDIWVNQNQIDILYTNEKYPLPPLSNFYLELYVNYLEVKSDTNQFIFVDLKRQTIHIFEKINGFFFLVKNIPCASGKTSTPTKRGTYKIYDKGPVFYNESKFYKCYYWLKYSDKYLLHSIPYSLDGEALNTSIQQKVSNGCIRMYYKDAQWMYENIQKETTIWIN